MDKQLHDFFTEEYKPTYERVADDRVVQKYEGILPENLIGIWRLQGWSGYFDGLFWLVNPDEYEGILADWIDGTELQGKGEYYVIGKGAFGDLLVYEKRSAHFLKINSVFGFISLNKKKFETGASKDDAELSIMSKFVMFKKANFDVSSDGVGIFDSVFEKLGHLQPNEVYGFEPLLSLGGEISADKVSKMKDLVHLTLIRQFVDPVVRYL